MPPFVFSYFRTFVIQEGGLRSQSFLSVAGAICLENASESCLRSPYLGGGCCCRAFVILNYQPGLHRGKWRVTPHLRRKAMIIQDLRFWSDSPRAWRVAYFSWRRRQIPVMGASVEE